MSAKTGEAVPKGELINKNGEIKTDTTSDKTNKTSYPEIQWRRVLLDTGQAERVRQRGETEAKVSERAWQLTEKGLIEAALIYGKALDTNGNIDTDKAGILSNFAEVLKIVNPQLDFQNEAQIQEAVKQLMEKYPHQAAALGLIYHQEKLKAIQVAYNITVNKIEELVPATLPTRAVKQGELIVNPDGTISLVDRTITYEEFIKTPEGQKRRKLAGVIPWFGKEPITQEEFQEMFYGKPGKEGRARLVISKIDNPTYDQQKESFQQHLLELLDLSDLDPSKSEDFVYLFQNIQSSLLLKNEIEKVLGKSPEQLAQILQLDLPEIGSLTAESIKGKIEQQINKEQQKIAEETRKKLEESRQSQTEKAIRARLSERQIKLEEELEEARKREKQKGEGGEKRGEVISQSAISNEVLRVLNGLGFKGEIKDLLRLVNLPFSEREGSNLRALGALELEKAQIEAELQARRPDVEQLDAIRKEILKLRILQRQKITQRTKEGGPASQIQTKIQALEEEIKTNDNLKDLPDKQKRLVELSSEIVRYRGYLSEKVEINGEEKTVEEWLKEYARLNKTGTVQGNHQEGNGSIENLETDLSTVKVLLSWYDPKEQTARKERIVNFKETPAIALDYLEGINPELANVVKQIAQSNQTKFLRILTVCFSQNLIVPETQEEVERAKDLARFLNQYVNGLSTVIDPGKFENKIDHIRRQFLAKNI